MNLMKRSSRSGQRKGVDSRNPDKVTQPATLGIGDGRLWEEQTLAVVMFLDWRSSVYSS